MGKTWHRSEEQEVFLHEKVFDYPEARLRGRQEKFFTDLFESWFKQWSESETQFPDADPDNLTEGQVAHLRESVMARKQQLRNYIYWRTDHDRRLKRTTRKEVPTLEELLNGKRAKQGPRKKKLIDVYSRLYYEMKMAPEVERRIEATRPPGELKKGKAYHSRRMKIVQQVKKEMWEGESPEVHRQVEEEREKLGVGKSAEVEVEVEAGTRNDQLEVKRQQWEISMLGDTLDLVAKELHSRTGYVMSVLLGGLRPDGTIHALRLHCGETAEGHDFEESTVDYDDCVVKPWYSFIERVFPPSKRRAQAEFYKRTFKVKEGVVEANATAPIATEKWSSKDNGSDDEDDGGCDGAKGDDGIIPDIDANKQPTSFTTSSTMYNTHTLTASSQSKELSSLNPQSLPAGMETLESANPLSVSPGSDRGTEAATGASQSPFPETGISNPVEFPGIANPSDLFWMYPDADADSSTKTSFGPMTEELHSALGENSLLHSADYMSLLFQNSMPSGGLTMASSLDSTSNAWSFTGKASPSTTWSNIIAHPANPSDTPATTPPSSSPLDPQLPNSVNCSPSLTQIASLAPTIPSAPATLLDSPTSAGSTSVTTVSSPNTSHATTNDDPPSVLAPPADELTNAGSSSPNTSHATIAESLSVPAPPVDESTSAGSPSQQVSPDMSPSTPLDVPPSTQSPKQSKRGISKKDKENPSRTAPKKEASSVVPLQDMGNTNQARPQRDRKRKLHPDEQFVQEQEEREKRQRRGRGQKH